MTEQWLTCGSQLQTKIILKKKSIASFTLSYKILLSINNEEYFYIVTPTTNYRLTQGLSCYRLIFPIYSIPETLILMSISCILILSIFFLVHTHFIHLSFSIDHTPFSENAAYSIAIHLHSSIILI